MAKKRGRPKGSKNVTGTAVVRVVPASCPDCGSKGAKVIKGSVTVRSPYHREHPEYGYVGWIIKRRKRCDKCPCVFIEQEYK